MKLEAVMLMYQDERPKPLILLGFTEIFRQIEKLEKLMTKLPFRFAQSR